MKKIGIIGAGLSSLYAACYLAKKGYSVDVYDKNKMAGGRSQVYKDEGYTFDMGPSWYWMPDVIDRLFSELDENRSDYFALKRLDPAYKVFWKNNESTSIPAGRSELLNLFDGFEKDGGKKLDRFLEHAKMKYNTAMHSFIEIPGLKIGELLKFEVAKGALKLDMFKSVEKDVSNRFESEKAQNILNFPVLFLGERASKIPALYTLMNYADLELGTWYPEGGMNAIANALEKIGKKYGVRYHYESPVSEIIVENKQVKGLKIKNEIINFDAIVAGADYNHVEQKLLPKEFRRYDENYWHKRKMAPSSLLFYIGLSEKVSGLEHHNLFFDESLEQHGKEIYETPQWPSKPLFYVCAASKTDDAISPEGHENLMILMPIAPDLEDSQENQDNYFNLIISRMEKQLGREIKSIINYKQSFSVNDFKSTYNAYKGNAYGLANTLKQTAHLKPKLTSKLKNLYFCGQLTVPGPGIPPALISGKIAAKQLITED
jgi:phytoene desaturase